MPKPKILVVDDNLANVKMLRDRLRGAGYEVVEAYDGVEGLEKAEAEGPDLVLLDIMMPKMDGYEVCRRLRSQGSTRLLPVIMITALREMQDKVKGLDAGADDFLSKPFNPVELQARVKSLLRLRQRQLDLVESEKMASLGRLVAGVAHEMNNPIGFIYANMYHLERYVEKLRTALADRGSPMEEDAEIDQVFEGLGKLIASCKNGAERTKKIVEDLRTFSRLHEAEFKEIDLHEAIESALTLWSGEFGKRVIVHREYGEIPPVQCYAGQVNQVLMHLLRNAGQAIADSGDVWIRTDAEEGHVAIEIRDNGVGIPAENLERIFDPFFTTREVGEGTGLGLSVSYGIVEQHGGTIEVESEVGAGSAFRVRLPMAGPG